MADDPLFEKLGKSAAAGEVLFRDGEAGEVMYVIRQGRVRIVTEVEVEGPKKKVRKQLAILGPGDFFGEMAILNDKPRTATAEVIEDAKLLVIDGDTLGAMIKQNTEIAVRLVKRLARRLDSANAIIDLLMHRDPKARTILGLAHEAEFNGVREDDGSVRVPTSRRALAQQVGLAEPEVDAVLQRLQRLRILEVQPDGEFRIPDVMRLHEFLEFLQMRERYGEP